MHSLLRRPSLAPADSAALIQRAWRLGVVTEPMAAFLLPPVLVALLARTADFAAVGAVIVALGLVLYRACAALGGRYIV